MCKYSIDIICVVSFKPKSEKLKYILCCNQCKYLSSFMESRIRCGTRLRQSSMFKQFSIFLIYLSLYNVIWWRVICKFFYKHVDRGMESFTQFIYAGSQLLPKSCDICYWPVWKSLKWITYIVHCMVTTKLFLSWPVRPFLLKGNPMHNT